MQLIFRSDLPVKADSNSNRASSKQVWNCKQKKNQHLHIMTFDIRAKGELNLCIMKCLLCFYRSLYFYAHILCLLLILFCRNIAKSTKRKEASAKTGSTEENKNWIYKLEHKGASAEINDAKRLKLN